MADPAIEAARTAWRAELPLVPVEHFVGQTPPRNLTRAAREALKPIRELAEELRATHLHQLASDEARERYLGVEYVLGKLVPLIYSSEELAQ